MTKEAFDPRQAPEYLALIASGAFTADELEPLLAALPQGSTAGLFMDDDGEDVSTVVLRCGAQVQFGATDDGGPVQFWFTANGVETDPGAAADAWAEWVAMARKQHAALGAVLAAVGGAS